MASCARAYSNCMNVAAREAPSGKPPAHCLKLGIDVVKKWWAGFLRCVEIRQDAQRRGQCCNLQAEGPHRPPSNKKRASPQNARSSPADESRQKVSCSRAVIGAGQCPAITLTIVSGACVGSCSYEPVGGLFVRFCTGFMLPALFLDLM